MMKEEKFAKGDIPDGLYKIINDSGKVLEAINGNAVWVEWSAQKSQIWDIRYFGPNWDGSQGYLISPSNDLKSVLFWDRDNGSQVGINVNSTKNTYTRLWQTTRSGNNGAFTLKNGHSPWPSLQVSGNGVIVGNGSGSSFLFDSNLKPPEKSGWSYIVTSDPQYPWTDKTDNGELESENIKRARSELLILTQYLDINDYNSNISTDSFVTINGDITAYGHDYQWEKMYDFLMPILNRPFYFGLGNHDIQNNQGDCFLDSCFRNSLKYMRMQVARNKITRHDVAAVASQNYALELPGNLFVLQLNNDPTMHYISEGFLEGSAAGVTPNINWIENQLKYARLQGYNIIVNVHKPNNWVRGPSEHLKDIFKKYGVRVIFAGHYHKVIGEFDAKLYFGDIPVYLSGSASQQTYIITEYNEKNMNIFSVRNNDWKRKVKIASILLNPMALSH
ncbi:metallophosphoesterase [Yersinia sp. 1252 StPb PI]|uniref:metallophosphoesterase n=1 Tax=Yersinia sp. 1252 StPb PI TaxID=3117404 RepID=UPI003B28D87E